MSVNCGIKAVERMAEVKELSMFTLIHMARDNGINLYFCKVEPNELVEVARPAIFHQKDHFVFIENGEAMPPGDYDGYVLTPRPLHEPLPHTLAKKIKGQKGSTWWQPIAIGVASFVNPILGAVVGAGLGGATAAGALGDEGKGEWWRVATGGLSGYTALSNPMLSGISAAVGEVPGAVKSGNWMAPISAGLGQYGVGTLAGGIKSGGLLNSIGIGGSGASGLASGSTGGAGVNVAQGAGITSIPTPSGYGGTYTIPGIGSSVLGANGAPYGLAGGSAALASAALPGTTASSAGGTSSALDKILGIGSSASKLLGLTAATAVEPPKYEGDITQSLSKAQDYLGLDNYKALPEATRTQLDQYVNMSIDDLTSNFYSGNDAAFRQLDEAEQKALDEVNVMYANYGQDPLSSTQAQQTISDIKTQYATAKSELEQKLVSDAKSKAITFKLDILAKSMEQGQFDYESAMELATYINRDAELKWAMETQNYEVLQDVLAEIFSMGQNAGDNNQSGLFGQLSSVLGK